MSVNSLSAPSPSGTSDIPATPPNAIPNLPSIQLLDLERTQNYIKKAANYKKGTAKNLLTMITLIVEIYNEKHKKKTEDSPGQGTKPSPSSDLKVFKSTTSNSSSTFNCSIFTKTKESKILLLKPTDKTSKATEGILNNRNTICIHFYYRTSPKREIFALTTDYGWKIVRPCINFQFIKNVSMRILNPNRITHITRRCLLGSNVQETLINPSGYELCKTNTLYYLVDSFTADIKIGSSLHALFDSFSITKPKYIKISSGLLRIDTKIPAEKHIDILYLLSKYHRGSKTFTTNKKEETLDSQFEFLNFLQKANELTKDLNRLLVEQIITDKSEKRYRTHLFYKHLQDFLEGHSFKIQLEPQKHYEDLCNHPPTIETIVDYLTNLQPPSDIGSTNSSSPAATPSETEDEKCLSSSDITGSPTSSNSDTNLEGTNNPEETVISEETPSLSILSQSNKIDKLLIDLFERGSLQFKTTNEETIQQKLINYLEGEVRYKNESYFKIKGVWYRLQADFHSLLHQDFRQISRSLIVSPDNEPKLPKRWSEANPSTSSKTKHKQEETYNRLYLHTNINKGTCFDSNEGYIVLDQVKPYEIEPCDIVRYTATTTYLIHVKASFGKETRTVCSQILNAAKEFRSTSLHQTDGFLSKLWEEATAGKETSAFRTSLKQQLDHLGKTNFFKIFFEKRLVFVYAYVPTHKVSLTEESKKLTHITPEGLTSIENFLNPPEELFEQLQNSGYLDSQGRITSKFYSTTQDKFKKEFKISYNSIELTQQVKVNIYDEIAKNKPTSDSTIAKLELLHLAKEIRDLGFELKVSEIQPNETIGSTTESHESVNKEPIDFKPVPSTSTSSSSPSTSKTTSSTKGSSTSSSASSTSDTNPNLDTPRDNAYKHRKNPNYQYQAADIAAIQPELFTLLPKKLHLLEPLQAAFTQDREIERLSEICSRIKEKTLLGTYNLGGGHWVVFYLFKKTRSSVICLYKDSFGNQHPQHFKDALNTALKPQKLTVEFLCNTQKEQNDRSSCGVFALENMKILINQLENVDFINKFKNFTGFCTQKNADLLRQDTFASLRLTSVYHSLKEEQKKAACGILIRNHHKEEVNQLGELLQNNIPEKKIKLLDFHESIDRDHELNTIAVELSIEEINLSQNDYRYTYCFRSTNDIPLSELHTTLTQQLNIRADEFAKDEIDHTIKLDPALVTTIAKIEKMTEFPDPAFHIDEDELFQTLYLETEEQKENVREMLHQISQKTQSGDYPT